MKGSIAVIKARHCSYGRAEIGKILRPGTKGRGVKRGWCTRDLYLSAVTSPFARFSRLASFNRMKRNAGPMASNEKNPVGKEECVRSSTTGYAASEARDVIISFRITRTLAEQIEDYRKRQPKWQSKTQVITYLLQVGLFIVEKAQSLGDPTTVRYLREHLYNMQLVDDIMEWPQDRIEAVIGALAGERERRFRLKLGKH